MTRPRAAFRAALACLAVAAMTAVTGPAMAQTAASPLRSLPLQPLGPSPGHATPLFRLASSTTGTNGSGKATSLAAGTVGEPGGYDPGELRAYLGLRGTGAGQTIAVPVPYDVQNPLPQAAFGEQDDVTNSLAGYDAQYGLPPACPAGVTTGCFNLTFTAPQGLASPVNFDGVNWMEDAVLEIEVIHALVPQASIAVVEAYDDTPASLMAAVGYASGPGAAAVAGAWTLDESSGEQASDSSCQATGSPCVFAAGDAGNYATCAAEGGSPCGGYPAADPGVLTVGGTTLDLSSAAGEVVSETAWSGSGGGVSAYEPLPAYQDKADPYPGGRGIPDVSFDADPNSGFAFYLDFTALSTISSWLEAGGTALGAGAWSAILASADQLRAADGKHALTIGQIQAAVYAPGKKKPVADITTGDNGICGADCSAAPGYDLVTGEGSPRAGLDSYLASTGG